MAQILVVDDSAFQRSILKKVIESAGHSVIEAPNGREGIEKATALKPGLITMDLLMPDMSGQETLMEMNKLGLKIPTVIISADIQESTKKDCMNLGAVGFINKPLQGPSIEALINLIRCYL
ncbi:MAG: response regulator [Nitrospinae bacterium]|nr:response regulator [Nitrospinota bacterium]